MGIIYYEKNQLMLFLTSQVMFPFPSLIPCMHFALHTLI